MKKEKLQSELTQIDDELFELEKKYGEFKRPKREKKAVQKAVVKQEEESTAEQAEPSGQAELEIPQYGEPETAETKEVDETQEVKEDTELDLTLSKAEMMKIIQEYQDQVRTLEEQVDAAAEEEDYDKAEEL